MNTKTCSKCKTEKSLFGFHKDKHGKYGRSPWCIKCRKQYDKDRNRSEYDKQHYRDNIEHRRQYAKDNKERFAPYHIQYQRDHCEQRALYSKQYEIDNALRIKQCRNSGALFETYFKQLKTFEKVRQCLENSELLEVKCTYCGKWTIPTVSQIKNRLQAFNGNRSKGTENRFYCSEACKQTCPIYKQIKY